MDNTRIAAAAQQLFEARQGGNRLDQLAADTVPASSAEAHAVQDALVALLGESVVGWKVSGIVPENANRGAILESRFLDSPASISASDMPLRGIEAEVAFRFTQDFPDRATPYSYDEIADAVVAFAAIEVVDTRFASYTDTPALHRLCDLMSNGALVRAEEQPDWRRLDLANVHVTLRCGSEILQQQNGGHGNGDPLLPAVALVNAMRGGQYLRAGQVATTGTYTGLRFVPVGERVTASFEGLETVEVTFEP